MVFDEIELRQVRGSCVSLAVVFTYHRFTCSTLCLLNESDGFEKKRKRRANISNKFEKGLYPPN